MADLNFGSSDIYLNGKLIGQARSTQITLALPGDLTVECPECGVLCLNVGESPLCQDCFNWPSVLLEDLLDAELLTYT